MQLIRKQVLLLTLSWLYSKESQQLYSAADAPLENQHTSMWKLDGGRSGRGRSKASFAVLVDACQKPHMHVSSHPQAGVHD